MTTKPKKTASGARKLQVKKETIRDLKMGGSAAKEVRGGAKLISIGPGCGVGEGADCGRSR